MKGVGVRLYDILRELSKRSLKSAREENLLRGSSKKEDVVSALSDLQAAVFEFMATYDEVQGALRLPRRGVDLERVRVRKAVKNK